MQGISGRGRRPYCPTTQGRSMGGMGAWVLKSVVGMCCARGLTVTLEVKETLGIQGFNF